MFFSIVRFVIEHLYAYFFTFSLYSNHNSYVNLNSNPAMSDSNIQACKILTGGCSGTSAVSRVRVRVKVRVRDQCVKGLK